MKIELIGDADLRARWSYRENDPIVIPEHAVLTPCAQEFVREHHITLVRQTSYSAMSRTRVPHKNGKPVFKELRTGHELSEKPEELTHLRGNLLVSKTHPRIAFRGQLDSLIAEILILEHTLLQEEHTALGADIAELLSLTQRILGAEVKDEPLDATGLFGMDEAQLRHASHDIRQSLGMDHPIPQADMPLISLQLNRLRTKAREAELSAARAFEQPDGTFARLDLICAMNRLSSGIYLLFCRTLAGYYDRRHLV